MRSIHPFIALLVSMVFVCCVTEDDMPADLGHALETEGAVTFYANTFTLDDRGVLKMTTHRNVTAVLLSVLMGALLLLVIYMMVSRRKDKAIRAASLSPLRTKAQSSNAKEIWRDVALVSFAALSFLLSLSIFGEIRTLVDPRAPHILVEQDVLFGLISYNTAFVPRPKSVFECGSAPHGSIGYTIYLKESATGFAEEGQMTSFILAHSSEGMRQRCDRAAEGLNRLGLPPSP